MIFLKFIKTPSLVILPSLSYIIQPIKRLFGKRIKKEHDCLSNEIKKEFKKLKIDTPKKKFRSVIFPFIFEDKILFTSNGKKSDNFKILLVIVLITVYFFLKQPFHNQPFQDINALSASLITTLFLLLALMIELNHNANLFGVKKVEIYLRYSKLHWFSFYLLFILIIGHCFKDYSLVYNLFIITALLLFTFPVVRLVKISFDKNKQWEISEELWEEKLERMFAWTLEQVMGDKILSDKLEFNANNLKLGYIFEKKDDVYTVRSDKSGILLDIDIQKLLNAIEYRKETSNKRITSEDRKIELGLLLPFRDRVHKNNSLLRLPLGYKIDEVKFRESLKIVDIFVTPFDDFREEVSFLTQAIFLTAKNFGDVKRYIDRYFKIFKYIIEKAKKVNYKYNTDLPEFLIHNYYNIVATAIKFGNKSIALDICYLPFRVINLSINKNAPNTTKPFFYFPSYIYNNAIELKDGNYKNTLLDVAGRYLKETSWGLRASKLNNKETKNIKVFKKFAKSIFYSYRDLMMEVYKDVYEQKSILDKKPEKFETYKQWLNKYLEFYSGLFKYINDNNNANTETINEIILMKQQVLFGISAFIFGDLKNSKNNSDVFEVLSKTFNIIKGNIAYQHTPKDVTKLFLECSKSKFEDGWTKFEADRYSEGMTYSVRFSKNLQEYYYLKLLTAKTTDSIYITEETNKNRDVLYYAEEGIKFYDDILQDYDTWGSIIKAVSGIEKKEDLETDIKNTKEYLNKIIKKIKEREKTEIIEKPISETRKKRFENEICEEFKRLAFLNKKLKNSNGKCEKGFFGYNTITPKEAFIANWPVDFVDWGNSYGRGLAYGEDKKLFSDIQVNLKKSKTNLEQLKEHLFNRVENMKQNGARPDIIVSSFDISDYLGIGKDFTPRWLVSSKENEIYFNGKLKVGKEEIPIYYITESSEDKKLFILNFENLGTLIRDITKDNSEKDMEVFCDDKFLISTKDLNDEKEAQKIVDEKSEWLKEYGKEEAQKQYLKTKVLLTIKDKFKYEPAKDENGKPCKNGGYVINCQDSEEN